MAGLGARLFPAFSKLTSAQVNGYLMDQTIMRFATTAARDAAFGGAGEPTLAEGMTCYLDDTNVLQSYNGTAWVSVAASQTTANVSGGLVYVSSTPIPSGVTTVSVNNCFSSAYTNYRVVVEVTSNTVGNESLQIQFVNSSGTPSISNYKYIFLYSNYSTAAVSGAGNSAGSSFSYAVQFLNTQGGAAGIDIYRPFLEQVTSFASLSPRGDLSGTTTGYHDVMASYPSMKLFVGSGTFTGGNIVVYGYQKA